MKTGWQDFTAGREALGHEQTTPTKPQDAAPEEGAAERFAALLGRKATPAAAPAAGIDPAAPLPGPADLFRTGSTRPAVPGHALVADAKPEQAAGTATGAEARPERGAAGPPAGALGGEADRLAALQQDAAGGRDGPARTPAPGPERPDPAALMLPGDAILRGLGGPAPAATPPPSGEVGRLLHQIAERVLVSDPSQTGEREVRIQIKDSVFPGLEIRLSQPGDRLLVDLVVRADTDPAALQSQVAALAEHLARRLARPVEVRVVVDGAEDHAAGPTGPDGGPLAPFRLPR